MHHPTDRIAHTTVFVTPVMEHWLEREIAQWVHPMKDRSDDPSHHERTLYLWATSRSFDLLNTMMENTLTGFDLRCRLYVSALPDEPCRRLLPPPVLDAPQNRAPSTTEETQETHPSRATRTALVLCPVRWYHHQSVFYFKTNCVWTWHCCVKNIYGLVRNKQG